MNPLLQTSLRRKLILVIMLAAGMTLLLCVAGFLMMEARNFRASTLRELQILADVVGEGSTAAIEFRDPDEAEHLLSALGAQKHITDAAIMDRQGQVLASYLRPGAQPGPLPSGLPPSAFGFRDRRGSPARSGFPGRSAGPSISGRTWTSWTATCGGCSPWPWRRACSSEPPRPCWPCAWGGWWWSRSCT